MLDTYRLQANEVGYTLLSTSFRDPTPASDGMDLTTSVASKSGLVSGHTSTLPEYFVVGTLQVEPEPERELGEESEVVMRNGGRILVFEVRDHKLRLEAEYPVSAEVYALGMLRGSLVVGVHSQVIVLDWVLAADGVFELVEVAAHSGHTDVLSIDVRGDFVLVGDLVKSMTLLHYVEDTVTKTRSLLEIARDFRPNWMTAVTMLDDDTFLGAENSFNLFTLTKNVDALTSEERRQLVVGGEYHLGHLVNCIRRASLVMQLPDAEAFDLETHIFGTVSGVIGVVTQLPPVLYQTAHSLQAAMQSLVPSVADLPHEEWRAFSNERTVSNSHGFVDGDLVETFLGLPEGLQEEICVQAKAGSRKEMVKFVEKLSRAIH